MSETLDGNQSTPERPGLLSALCVLSFIGSGLTALMGLLGIFASGWVMSMFSEGIEKAEARGASRVDAEAAEGIAAMGTGLLIGVFVIVLIFGLMKLFGAIKMWKLQKGGFFLYAIPEGLIVLGAFAGGSYLAGVLGVVFIVGYGMNLKHMK